jgi:signal transduction histidine kinase/ActR/RegA family two-component response regulator
MRATNRKTSGELLTGLGALVLAVLLQGAIVWTTLDRLQGLDDADDEARTELLHSDAMIEAVQDQDAGLRGFLASRDPAYLRAYEGARLSFDLGVPKMVELAADDPQFARERIADIVRRNQLWVKTVADPQIGAARAGIALHDAPNGRADIEAIRADFAVVRGEQTRLLEERDGLWGVAFRTSKLTLLLGSGAALSFAILIAARSLMRLVQQRQAAQEAAATLADALERAHAAERAKTLFLSNMSHEMRTPLNGVAGMAEALGRTALDPSQQQLLGVIRESAATLDGLIGDLLTLSRGERPGEAVLKAAPFDLGAAVRALAEEHRAAAWLKGLGLEAVIASDCEIRVTGDAARLQQLLSCLLSNAVKFTDRGEVRLTVEAGAEGRYRFTVADTGVGFDEARKAELFETFSQSDDTATRRHGGAGLGLALVRQLASDLGGQLDCSSTPGRGSVFTFEVGMAPAADALADAAATTPPEADAPLRILVVDDNATNRKVLELILEQLGVEWVSAEDGRQAVDAAARQAFAAILMDIQMPVMDGLNATREIRRQEQAEDRAAVPIIIVSANGQPEHVQAGRAAGAQLHLTKPVNVAELVGALNAVLGDTAGDGQAVAA